MTSSKNHDFNHCLSVQPRNKCPAISQATQELALELLALVNDDSTQAMGIIKQIMYYNPDKSLDWYCEQAIKKLNRQNYCIAS
ncbi:MAG: hypothetical protein AAF298_09885 [Cyanobacteria bacterium P01_A01_bin.40]